MQHFNQPQNVFNLTLSRHGIHMSQQTIIYSLLMLAAGLGIPIMAALNSALGAKLQSPTLATTILFFVGGSLSLVIFFLSGGVPKPASQQDIPLYYYGGGIFVIAYILGMTWVAPKFGVGNAISFVLLGQLISMSTIDHFGLLSAQHNPISTQRLIGLLFMISGVFLSVRRI